MATAMFLYIGTQRGLFVASKPGTSPDWRITKHVLEDRPVTALALGADIPVRILAALEGAGLFRSTNGGRAWDLVLPYAVAALVPDPDTPERVFAGLGAANGSTGAGRPSAALVSDDGGATWRPVAGLPGTDRRVCSLAITGGAAEGERRLWAGLESGAILYYNLAAPGEWQGAGFGLDERAPVYALAATGPAATDLFAATPGEVSRLARRARAADSDAGSSLLTWRAAATETPADLRRLLPVGRGGAALLGLDAAGRLWRGDAGGTTWTPLAAGEAAFRALAAHPEYPDRAYAGAENGQVWETRNRGTTWEPTGVATDSMVLSLAVAVIK